MSIFFLDLESETKDKFDPEKFLEFREDVHLITNSFFHEKLSTLPKRGQFTVTIEEMRPDNISHKLYFDTQFWWIILFYSDVISLDTLIATFLLNYFSIDELENFYYSLKTSEIKLTTENQITTIEQSQENSQPIIPDSNRVYTITNLTTALINHDLNKRPVPIFVALDNSDNEVEEDIFFYYPAGMETKQVFINFGKPKTGKVILN